MNIFSSKKQLYFNEIPHFGQFVKYPLFGSPFLLSKVPIGSPFHSKLGPHWVPMQFFRVLIQCGSSAKDQVFRKIQVEGSPYRDRVPIGTFLAFWVPIGSLFIFQGPYFQCFDYIYAENINSVCNAESAWIQQWVNMVCLWWVISCMLSYILLFRVTLLTNFDFYLCLRVNWVPISQKVGSLSQSLGVPIRLGDSV